VDADQRDRPLVQRARDHHDRARRRDGRARRRVRRLPDHRRDHHARQEPTDRTASPQPGVGREPDRPHDRRGSSPRRRPRGPLQAQRDRPPDHRRRVPGDQERRDHRRRRLPRHDYHRPRRVREARRRRIPHPRDRQQIQGARRPLHDVRDSIDGWRESLRKGNDASQDSGKEADRQRAKINKLRDEYDDARDKQRKLKKGTDEYRDAARDATKKAEAFTRAIADSGTKATNARRPVRLLRGNIGNLGDTSSTTAEAVIDDLNAALKGMGAKPINVKVSRRAASRAFGVPDIGGLPEKAIGGIANPAGGARDDHILIDPSGRPVAAMAGTEGIINRPQMGLVDTALAIANAATGGALPGSLGELWGMGLRHYQGGGAIVPVPGFPGERAASSVISRILGIARAYDLTLTDAYGARPQVPGHTRYGTAADFAGPDANMDRAVAALVRQGYTVLYDGRFGSRAYPGHGPSRVAGANAHLHVELGSAREASARPPN
jgi:hypothetical protein